MAEKPDNVGVCPKTPVTLFDILRTANGAKRDGIIETIVGMYHLPVYVYLRAWGHKHHRAQDLTQGFFVRNLRNSFGSSQFSERDIVDLDSLACRLSTSADPPSKFLRGRATSRMEASLKQYHANAVEENAKELRHVLTELLNLVADETSLFHNEAFRESHWRKETSELYAKQPAGLKLKQLNKLVLEDAYPVELSRNHNFFDYYDRFEGRFRNYLLKSLSRFANRADECDDPIFGDPPRVTLIELDAVDAGIAEDLLAQYGSAQHESPDRILMEKERLFMKAELISWIINITEEFERDRTKAGKRVHYEVVDLAFLQPWRDGRKRPTDKEVAEAVKQGQTQELARLADEMSSMSEEKAVKKISNLLSIAKNAFRNVARKCIVDFTDDVDADLAEICRLLAY